MEPKTTAPVPATPDARTRSALFVALVGLLIPGVLLVVMGSKTTWTPADLTTMAGLFTGIVGTLVGAFLGVQGATAGSQQAAAATQQATEARQEAQVARSQLAQATSAMTPDQLSAFRQATAGTQ